MPESGIDKASWLPSSWRWSTWLPHCIWMGKCTMHWDSEIHSLFGADCHLCKENRRLFHITTIIRRCDGKLLSISDFGRWRFAPCSVVESCRVWTMCSSWNIHIVLPPASEHRKGSVNDHNTNKIESSREFKLLLVMANHYFIIYEITNATCSRYITGAEAYKQIFYAAN